MARGEIRKSRRGAIPAAFDGLVERRGIAVRIGRSRDAHRIESKDDWCLDFARHERVKAVGDDFDRPARPCESADRRAKCHARHGRSEEHTSASPPQMRTPYAVFCLKKKN